MDVFDSVIELFTNNGSDPSRKGEFPLSDMSRKLCSAIWEYCIAHYESMPREIRALDVGTGSGVHAILMSALGFAHIDAIDICPVAVAAAKERWDLIGNDLPSAFGGEIKMPAFSHRDMDDFATDEHEPYDLIVFNPPGYFARKAIDLKSPLETGVFAGHQEEALNYNRSHLYRFFDHIVRKHLAEGGVVICTWPGLERRVVHDLKEAGQPIEVPVRLLEKWFLWQIKGPCSNAEEFYRFKRAIGDYGLGTPFLATISQQIGSNSSCYSDFVVSDPTHQHELTFRFGILSLRRISTDVYEIVDLDLGDEA